MRRAARRIAPPGLPPQGSRRASRRWPCRCAIRPRAPAIPTARCRLPASRARSTRHLRRPQVRALSADPPARPRARRDGAESSCSASAALSAAVSFSPAASTLTIASASCSSRKVAARRIRQHVGGFLGQHLAALVLVEHREPRRHVGLERHQMQQPLAESVDGVDLEPARRFDRASKQRAGEAELSAARRVRLRAPSIRRAGSRRPSSPIGRAIRRRGSPCWRPPPW